MTTVLERIDQRIAELGISRRSASIEAGLGPDYIRDLGRKKTASPGLTAIERLAPVLKTTVEWLSSGGDQAALPIEQFRPPPVFLGPDDLPVYRSAEAGHGYIVVTDVPIGFASRPSKLQGNEDAFAVVVAGESMLPEYEPGDLLLVDPWKPLVRDRNFIFVDDTNGNWTACVKRLLRWDAETFYVLQRNPPEGQQHEFTLPRANWPKVMRVIGKYDRD